MNRAMSEEATTMSYADPKEARRILGVSENTMYKLLREGKIAGAFKVGSLWRIPRPVRVIGDLEDEDL